MADYTGTISFTGTGALSLSGTASTPGPMSAASIGEGDNPPGGIILRGTATATFAPALDEGGTWEPEVVVAPTGTIYATDYEADTESADFETTPGAETYLTDEFLHDVEEPEEDVV